MFLFPSPVAAVNGYGCRISTRLCATPSFACGYNRQTVLFLFKFNLLSFPTGQMVYSVNFDDQNYDEIYSSTTFFSVTNHTLSPYIIRPYSIVDEENTFYTIKTLPKSLKILRKE